MEHDHQKRPTYQGITLYNPLDYLPTTNTNDLPFSNNLHQNETKQNISQQLKSTIIFIPSNENCNDESSLSNLQSNTKTSFNYSEGGQGESSTNQSQFHTISSIPHNSSHTTKDFFYSDSTAAHFSASGTQMLSDESFDIVHIEFPETPNFGMYLSGSLAEKDNGLRRYTSNERQILAPDYKLGKLPFMIGIRRRIPVFLAETAYNSDLHMRLAEIDEIMRGHPPEKKMKLDLLAFNETFKVEVSNASKADSGDGQGRDAQKKPSLKFIRSPEHFDAEGYDNESSDTADEDEMINGEIEQAKKDLQLIECTVNSIDRNKSSKILSQTPTKEPEHCLIPLEKEVSCTNLKNKFIRSTMGISISRILHKFHKLKTISASTIYTKSSSGEADKGQVEKYEIIEEQNMMYDFDRNVSNTAVYSGGSSRSLATATNQTDYDHTNPDHLSYCPNTAQFPIYSFAKENIDTETQLEEYENADKSFSEPDLQSSESSPTQSLNEMQMSLSFINSNNIEEYPTIAKSIALSETEEQIPEKVDEISDIFSHPLQSTYFSTESFEEKDDKSLKTNTTQNLDINQNPYPTREDMTLVVSLFEASKNKIPANNESTNTSTVQFPNEKKKLSVFKSILGIFFKKDADKNAIEVAAQSSLSKTLDQTPKRSFFQKLFKLSSPEVKSYSPSRPSTNSTPQKQESLQDLDSDHTNKTKACLEGEISSDLNGNTTPKSTHDGDIIKNPLGPKHVDSVSLMRKKRVKLFAETQLFYQDSIMAYRTVILNSAASTSTPPSCLTPTMTTPQNPNSELMKMTTAAMNQALAHGLVYPPNPNLLLSNDEHVGYKSTVSESVILPALSRRKRRLNQDHTFLLDGLDNSEEASKVQETSVKNKGKLVGILKNKLKMSIEKGE